MTGFRKRRQQRRVEGAAQAALKERRQRLQDRKDVSEHKNTLHTSSTLSNVIHSSLDGPAPSLVAHVNPFTALL